MADKIWARMDQNEVAELITLPDTFIPGQNIFSSDLTFVDVTNVSGIEVFWVETNGTFAAPIAPVITYTAAQLQAYAAQVRYAKMVGGITVSGTPIQTDASSQSLINGAVSLLTQDSSLNTIQFKSPSGWVDLSRNQMISIGVAVGQYIQACFAAERAIDASIASGSITDKPTIDNYSWPSNAY